MNPIRYMFFDCMETIVDLHELPSKSDYAFWAFSGSGAEHYWTSFDAFYKKYETAANEIDSSLCLHQDYEMVQRLERVVEQTDTISRSRKNQVTGSLYDRYWKTYKSKCYIKEENRQTLVRLSKKYKLAVVSNFKVKDGIEELLNINGVFGLFDFVVTSVRCGWRKPDSRIYEFAVEKAGCRPEQILFFGDDYEYDYIVPRRMGMKAIWLDKKGAATSGIDKVTDFGQLADLLL